MKKILFTALCAITFTGSFSQTPFLTKTCYRGAFAPAPTPMWTDTWTEWDPQNKVYPAPTQSISSNITSNTTFSTGITYLLQGPIYVTGNSILTIQPGVVIRGATIPAGSGLFITTGSKLMAMGTRTAPIVFTSDQAPGSRNPGDWGGVILLGLANNNNPSGINNIEGITPSSLTQYGGGTTPNDNDNSGVLNYVRIEFGGYIYAPNKEINGLTFGAVGRGTTIDYVQCSFTNDDSFEWFGGTVNCKHLVAYRGVDDDFDTDNGFGGAVQFCLGVRDPLLADPTYAAASGASTSEGFESDNDPNGSTSDPNTKAIFSNVTDIGPLRGVITATVHPGFRRGARIRRNSSLKIINSILMDHKTRGVYIDGTLSENNAAGTSTNTLLFKNNIVANYGQKACESQTASTAFNATINAWVKAGGNDTLPFIGGTASNTILVNPYSYLNPDYRPAPGSLALSGASFTDVLVAAETGTSSPQVAQTIPSSQCIGNGITNTPFTFVPSSTVSAGYCSLTWSASAGAVLSSSTALNPSVTISTTGTFTVFLIVTNENGTSSVPQSITTTTCTNVGLSTFAKQNGLVSLYPNPSSDLTSLKVSAEKAGSISISIYDLTGKLVQKLVENGVVVAGENTFTINTADFNNGIYFVTLNHSGSKETVKLVVNH
ncbi:MAG: T9SS type A sorting domain-containing protein [bacterium]|nr:T9SS type A sorting domain-containing protein [bacterium]